MFKKVFITCFVFLSLCLSANAQAEHQATPEERSDGVKRITGGVVNGKAESLPVPPYPAAARAANISGSVNVAIVIGTNGNVISAEAVSGHPLLRAAAVEAARLATFKPTLLSGVPVEVSGVLVYNFQPATDTPAANSSDDDTTPFAFAMLAGIYDKMKSDAEFTEIMDGMFEDINKADSSLGLKGKFSEKTSAEQPQIVRKAKELMTEENNASTKWQFQTGEIIGEFLGQFYSKVVEEESVMPEAELKSYLLKINSQLQTAPKTFPNSVFEKIKAVGDYSTSDNLGNSVRQGEIFEALLSLFETISSD